MIIEVSVMHELAVCQSLLDQVQMVAAENEGLRVSRITLMIGPLSGVVPDLLERAFTVACAGGIAAEAELVIHPVPVRVRCRSCGTEGEASPTRLVCRWCGDFHTDLLSGDELILQRVELTRDDAAGKAPAAVREEVRHV